MNTRRRRIFETLQRDVAHFEKEDLNQGKLPDHKDAISALEKVQIALQRTQEDDETFETLLEDVRMLLESV